MSVVEDRLRATVSRGSIQTFGGADHEGLPEVSALLCGKVGKSGVEWERVPFSLLLYLDGSIVKFKFGAGDTQKSIWGTIDSIKGGLLAIEEALCRGNFGTKPPQDNGKDFTHTRR